MTHRYNVLHDWHVMSTESCLIDRHSKATRNAFARSFVCSLNCLFKAHHIYLIYYRHWTRRT